MTKYVAPAPTLSAFTCPGCGTYAQIWRSTLGTTQVGSEFLRTACNLCQFKIIWSTDGEMLWPSARVGPPAHQDMPPAVREQYDEAADIGARSPRAAAAVLRLSLQTLLLGLVPGEENLNAAIGKLVQDGLAPMVQQAMDVLRFTGNNAVHPAEIQLHDDAETLQALFMLLNTVVEDRITRPQTIAALYDQLPDGIKEQIDRRDGRQ